MMCSIHLQKYTWLASNPCPWHAFEFFKSILTGSDVTQLKSDTRIVFSGKFYINYQNGNAGVWPEMTVYRQLIELERIPNTACCSCSPPCQPASWGRSRSFSNAAEIFMREAIFMKLCMYLESVKNYLLTKGKVTSGKTVPVRQRNVFNWRIPWVFEISKRALEYK